MILHSKKGGRSEKSGRSGQAGFTILELLVVLAIMGMVAAVVASGWPAKSTRANSRVAAEMLASTLREARSQSIREGTTVSVWIDTQKRTFGIGRVLDRSLPEGLQLALLTGRGDAIGSTQGRIRFMPDGHSTGGRIDITTSSGKAAVGVDWLSGRVSIVDAR